MTGKSKIGHNQRQILTVLYDYRERYPDKWVPYYRLINDLKMAETVFSRAIQPLVETHSNGNNFNPLVEMTHPSIAYREFQGSVVPLPDNATMSDALSAMKYTWESSDARSHFYRITDLGVERLDNLTSGKRRKRFTKSNHDRGESVNASAMDFLTRGIKEKS